MIYIVGVGGVGSWLAAAMVRLVGPHNLTLVDGDTLELKNLDRQLFSESELGENKAEVMAKRMKCKFIPEWYSGTSVAHTMSDWIMGCADNNPARLSILEACDGSACSTIIAANETHSSEAYVYLPEWRDSPLDPRVYYKEIAEDETGDPARAAIGCTGEAQAANPQLVTANFMAAALAAHLYVVWAMERRKVKPEVHAFLPHRLFQNLTRNSHLLRGELVKQTKGE